MALWAFPLHRSPFHSLLGKLPTENKKTVSTFSNSMVFKNEAGALAELREPCSLLFSSLLSLSLFENGVGPRRHLQRRRGRFRFWVLSGLLQCPINNSTNILTIYVFFLIISKINCNFSALTLCRKENPPKNLSSTSSMLLPKCLTPLAPVLVSAPFHMLQHSFFHFFNYACITFMFLTLIMCLISKKEESNVYCLKLFVYFNFSVDFNLGT